MCEQGILRLALLLNLTPDDLSPRLVALAHSFGCAVALQYAATVHPFRKMVLVAPFTTLHDALAFRVGCLGYLIPDGMDNTAFVREILRRDSTVKLIVFHGKLDESIPFSMGEKISQIDPCRIQFHDKSDVGHEDILVKYRDEIYAALIE
jgi:predicted alpha/beta hydrolase family esterase